MVDAGACERDSNGMAGGGVMDLETDHFLNFAATLIQKNVRGYQQRQRLAALKHSSSVIQQAWKQHERVTISRELAAVILQCAWRSYHGRQTFLFYRDLISFKEQGDPKEVLRFINPREASLIDAAAGVHIRFRLGGACFPPLVFYKIFTHRPVLDIGFFCPRNYAGEAGGGAPDSAAGALGEHNRRKRTQRPAAQEQNFDIPDSLRQYVRRDGSLGTRELRGWYRRTENNGWRPVCEAALVGVESFGCTSSRRAPMVMHFSPAVRKEDRIRRHKAKRREWMVAMYRQQAPEERDPQLFDPNSKHGLPADVDTLPDEILLQWCGGLDFDDYLEEWQSVATTYGSEAFAPQCDTPDVLPQMRHVPLLPYTGSYAEQRGPVSVPTSAGSEEGAYDRWMGVTA